MKIKEGESKFVKALSIILIIMIAYMIISLWQVSIIEQALRECIETNNAYINMIFSDDYKLSENQQVIKELCGECYNESMIGGHA